MRGAGMGGGRGGAGLGGWGRGQLAGRKTPTHNHGPLQAHGAVAGRPVWCRGGSEAVMLAAQGHAMPGPRPALRVCGCDGRPSRLRDMESLAQLVLAWSEGVRVRPGAGIAGSSHS